MIHAPAALAEQTLFEPVADLLRRFPEALPKLEALNALIEERAPTARSAAGHPIRFIPPPAQALSYEEHIHATGQVPTRPDNWHDFFNALAWCVWPHSKAACNALHLHALQVRRAAGLQGRGPVRDALTQFDECGVLVVSADPEIPGLLAGHQWEEAFWHRRGRLLESTRFLVFGHGCWDALRAPFFGLCGKALYRAVRPDWLALPPASMQAEADAWLAAHLLAPDRQLKDALFPLPLLGIPGVTGENRVQDYYRDSGQFRPRAMRTAKHP